MSFVGAIDQGTTSSRFILFDKAGSITSFAQLPFSQIIPGQGLTEHDAEEIWSSVSHCITEALKRSNPNNSLKRNIALSEIACVGVTNQRETTVVWDRRTGKPLNNALVWMDTRSTCPDLATTKRFSGKDASGRTLSTETTGLPLSPYFSGTKLKWLLANVPGLLQLAEDGHAVAGTIDTWLLWKLSGGELHITDVTNASRTLLMDIKTFRWDAGQCEAFGVPMSMLPEIRSSSEVYCLGSTKYGGPLAGVKISGILGDQQAALFGQAGMNPGACKNTYGTGCFTLCNVGGQLVYSKAGLLSTVAYKLGPNQGDRVAYALEGSIPFAGACVEWLVKGLELIPDQKSSSELADSNDNGGVYFVPAFSGLYAPYWRDDARGVIAGLTRYSTKAHLVRAALEAVCFQTREVCEAMQKDAADAGVKLGDMSVLKVDGGMTINSMLMQMQADLLGAEVHRPKILETTALGAAYAAGLATGFWASVDELMGQWQLDKAFKPDASAYPETRRASEFGRWKRAVQRTLNWTPDEDPPVASGGKFCMPSLLLGGLLGAGALLVAHALMKRSKP